MRVFLCGDISPTSYNMELFAAKDSVALFGDIADLFKTADEVIINLEVSLTEGGAPIKKIGPPLKATPNTAEVMRDIGITACGMANNHILDMGAGALFETMRYLDAAGIKYFGAGKNDTDSRVWHVCEKDGSSLAVIAVGEHEYTYALPDAAGANPYDPYDTLDDIRAAKKTSDHVVVMYHGGKEFCCYPSPRLRKACRAMVKAGADAVFCQHSHVIGTMEEYMGKHIVYGQGNFHFIGQPGAPRWGDFCHEGLIAEIEAGGGAFTVNYIPVISNGKGLRLMNGDEKKAALGLFAKRSEKLNTDAWLTEWHEFCVNDAPGGPEQVKTLYTEAVRRTLLKDEDGSYDGFWNELFKHHLYCETHTDVMLELFKTWRETLKY